LCWLYNNDPRYRALFDGVPPKKLPKGAGAHLKDSFAKWGFKPDKKCKCNERAAEMDHNGTKWCRENIDTIVGWLREEKERAGMPIPFFDTIARQFVLAAIQKAECC
jgi:hypothetical protein